MSVTRFTGPIWLPETLNLHQYVTHVLMPSFEHMFNCKRTFHFASNAVKQLTSQTVLYNVYIVLAIIINRRIWPSHSPDLTFCDFVRYLLRCLTKSQRLKSKVMSLYCRQSERKH